LQLSEQATSSTEKQVGAIMTYRSTTAVPDISRGISTFVHLVAFLAFQGCCPRTPMLRECHDFVMLRSLACLWKLHAAAFCVEETRKRIAAPEIALF
jgi:hypothetical protein